MKRFLLLIAALCLTVVHGWSVPTAVTGTIVGADGLPYANGTLSALLTNAAGVSYDKLPYNAQTANIPIQSFSAPLDLTGSFAIALAPNSLVTGSFWTITGCNRGNTPTCFTYLATISGASQSLSSQLSAAAVAALSPSSLATVAYVNTHGGGAAQGAVNTVQTSTGAGAFKNSGLTASYYASSAMFIGTNAGITNPATANIAIGINVLPVVSTNGTPDGEANVCIGIDTCTSLTTGRETVAIGYNALHIFSSTSGTTGTPESGLFVAIGASSLAAASTNSINSVCIGQKCLQFDTESINDIFMGAHAGIGLTTSNNCVGIGIGVYSGTGTCDSSIALGTFSGYSATTPVHNVNLGNSSLYACTTCQQEAIVGANSMSALLSGNDNVAIGYGVGYGTTSLSSAVLIGTAAGAYVTDPGSIGIGYYSLGGDTHAVGTGYTAIGYQSGRHLTTATNFTSLGYNAGLLASTGSDNTLLGFSSGSAVTTGNNLTLVGSQSAASAITDTYEICVGSGCVGHGSNTATIGDSTHTTQTWVNGIQMASILYSAAGTPLPTCGAGINGAQAVVSDATVPTYLGAYVSGGALTTPVVCRNGTGWLTH